eukprot:TRINITY_DN3121_c0_g1_i1.p1 TRINITY_DN3121_c0_g1~~TRINITY_DN3121_c0_g1_i1.p1  ORF type:complete len:551 (-),score=218.74 TRINITY_DN3121_c0_g1_i1:3-1655(-)
MQEELVMQRTNNIESDEQNDENYEFYSNRFDEVEHENQLVSKEKEIEMESSHDENTEQMGLSVDESTIKNNCEENFEKLSYNDDIYQKKVINTEKEEKNGISETIDNGVFENVDEKYTQNILLNETVNTKEKEFNEEFIETDENIEFLAENEHEKSTSEDNFDNMMENDEEKKQESFDENSKFRVENDVCKVSLLNSEVPITEYPIIGKLRGKVIFLEDELKEIKMKYNEAVERLKHYEENHIVFYVPEEIKSTILNDEKNVNEYDDEFQKKYEELLKSNDETLWKFKEKEQELLNELHKKETIIVGLNEDKQELRNLLNECQANMIDFGRKKELEFADISKQNVDLKENLLNLQAISKQNVDLKKEINQLIKNKKRYFENLEILETKLNKLVFLIKEKQKFIEDDEKFETIETSENIDCLSENYLLSINNIELEILDLLNHNFDIFASPISKLSSPILSSPVKIDDIADNEEIEESNLYVLTPKMEELDKSFVTSNIQNNQICTEQTGVVTSPSIQDLRKKLNSIPYSSAYTISSKNLFDGPTNPPQNF